MKTIANGHRLPHARFLDRGLTLAGTRPDDADRLSVLQRASAEWRDEVLARLPGSERSKLLGSTAVDVEQIRQHRTGPVYDVDFGALPVGKTYSGKTAHAMAVLAQRAYEAYGVSGSDPASVGDAGQELARQGWAVRYIGKPPPGACLGDVSYSAQAFVAVKDGRALISARGTEPDRPEDLLVDAEAWRTTFAGSKGEAHAGFVRSVEQLWPDIERVLVEEQAKLPAGQTLSVRLTGHSLGAAIATLLAARIEGQLPLKASIDGVYLFGAPRVFDDAGAADFDTRLGSVTYRLVNNRDIVTELGPEALGYRHVGLPMYFDARGALGLAFDSSRVEKDRVMTALSLEGPAKLLVQGGEVEPLWDHGMHGYVKHTFLREGEDPFTGAGAKRALDEILRASGPTAKVRRTAVMFLSALQDGERTKVLFRAKPQVARTLQALARDDSAEASALRGWLDGIPGRSSPG